MSFADAVATQGPVIRLWVLWLTVIMLATPAVLLFFRATRRDAVVVLTATLATIVSMQWLYGEMGFVRLLGLPHVVIWTPLAVYLVLRLIQGGLPALPRIAIKVFLASILVSLVFDYIDVIRWLLGERGSMLPPDGSG